MIYLHVARACARAAVACVSIGLGSTPASTAQPIALAPNWSKGDRVQLEISKSRSRTEPGKEPVAMEATGSIEVEVLETGPEGHVLRWTYGETHFPPQALQGNPLLARLENLAQGRHIELVLDADVNVTRVRNFEEIQAAMSKVFDAVRDELVADGAPGDVEGVLNQLRPVYATEEAVRTHVVRLAPIYLFPLGRSLVPGETVSYEDVLANPFGGEPLPCVGSIRVESVESGVAKLTWTQEVDGERARAMLQDMAKRVEAAGAPKGSMDSVKLFELTDRGDYVIDLRSGWVEQMTHVRTTAAGPGSEQIEKTKIQRKRS